MKSCVMIGNVTLIQQPPRTTNKKKQIKKNIRMRNWLLWHWLFLFSFLQMFLFGALRFRGLPRRPLVRSPTTSFTGGAGEGTLPPTPARAFTAIVSPVTALTSCLVCATMAWASRRKARATLATALISCAIACSESVWFCSCIRSRSSQSGHLRGSSGQFSDVGTLVEEGGDFRTSDKDSPAKNEEIHLVFFN